MNIWDSAFLQEVSNRRQAAVDSAYETARTKREAGLTTRFQAEQIAKAALEQFLSDLNTAAPAHQSFNNQLMRRDNADFFLRQVKSRIIQIFSGEEPAPLKILRIH